VLQQEIFGACDVVAEFLMYMSVCSSPLHMFADRSLASRCFDHVKQHTITTTHQSSSLFQTHNSIAS